MDLLAIVSSVVVVLVGVACGVTGWRHGRNAGYAMGYVQGLEDARDIAACNPYGDFAKPVDQTYDPMPMI